MGKLTFASNLVKDHKEAIISASVAAAVTAIGFVGKALIPKLKKNDKAD